MFWILAAGMTAIVAFVVLAPLRRGRAPHDPAAAYDLRVYRDQLSEVDRDLDRGVLAPEDAQRLRAEIGRKVLDADRRLSRQAAPEAPFEARPGAPRPAPADGSAARGAGALWPALILGAMLAGGVLLYLREGVPGAPDLPLSERIAAAEAAYASRPAQAEAEARRAARDPAAAPADAPAGDAPSGDAFPGDAQADDEYRQLIAQLREAVARNPEDPRGLELLAGNELRLGNLAAARAAQDRLIAVLGPDATAPQLMQQATLMIEAAGGLVTPEAEAALSRALTLDPGQPQARYLRGVLLIQNGRPDLAFPIWRDLLDEGPGTAPWIAPIRAAIEDLAWLAGDADYRPPAPAPAPDADADADAATGLPGPDAEALAAAGDLSPADRDAMARGMVDRLQARLASQGGTPEEWARLIAGLAVLDQREQAAAILAEARQRFANAPEALEPIEAAARQAGL